jgi:hypothetical protein
MTEKQRNAYEIENPSHRGTGFAGPQVAPPWGGGAEGASGGV